MKTESIPVVFGEGTKAETGTDFASDSLQLLPDVCFPPYLASQHNWASPGTKHSSHWFTIFSRYLANSEAATHFMLVPSYGLSCLPVFVALSNSLSISEGYLWKITLTRDDHLIRKCVKRSTLQGILILCCMVTTREIHSCALKRSLALCWPINRG